MTQPGGSSVASVPADPNPLAVGPRDRLNPGRSRVEDHAHRGKNPHHLFRHIFSECVEANHTVSGNGAGPVNRTKEFGQPCGDKAIGHHSEQTYQSVAGINPPDRWDLYRRRAPRTDTARIGVVSACALCAGIGQWVVLKIDDDEVMLAAGIRYPRRVPDSRAECGGRVDQNIRGISSRRLDTDLLSCHKKTHIPTPWSGDRREVRRVSKNISGAGIETKHEALVERDHARPTTHSLIEQLWHVPEVMMALESARHRRRNDHACSTTGSAGQQTLQPCAVLKRSLALHTAEPHRTSRAEVDVAPVVGRELGQRTPVGWAQPAAGEVQAGAPAVGGRRGPLTWGAASVSPEFWCRVAHRVQD